MTDVLAVDLATNTGWCRGHVGAVPVFGSLRFGKHNSRDCAIFADALSWFSDFLYPKPRPDVVILEALLPPSAWGGESQASTFNRLAGLYSIMLGVAHLRNIPEISTASVPDVRAHFIGARSLKRAMAKRAVMDRCWRLDWQVKNDNEGDACALWSYACALIDPQLAMNVVPLFQRKLIGDWLVD
jgi:crossover junction endodeoxyribonuclease RuvC